MRNTGWRAFMKTETSLLFRALTLLLLVPALLLGCGGSEPLALTKPDIVGTITYASSTTKSRIAGEDMTITVEGKVEKGAAYDRASVRVADETRVFVQKGDAFVSARPQALAVGQKVQATFTGPVAESYPVQATAGEIVIVSSKSIEAVKEERTGELMAIEGVVGVGIGESNGREVIKVFLEDSSPDLRALVPLRLDGYQVVTEVTGPVRTQ